MCLNELAVTGSDLIDAGMKQGREVGAVLSELLADVLDNPEHNTRQYLIELYHKRHADL